jgi:hypothetical protein
VKYKRLRKVKTAFHTVAAIVVIVHELVIVSAIKRTITNGIDVDVVDIAVMTSNTTTITTTTTTAVAATTTTTAAAVVVVVVVVASSSSTLFTGICVGTGV